MNITLTYKSVFGRDHYYPDDAISTTIAILGGFKSFTEHQINVMQKAGWNVEIKAALPRKL